MGQHTLNYLHVVSKLFDNFNRILSPNDIRNLLGSNCLEDVTSSDDQEASRHAPVPILISLFKFKDPQGYNGEIEASFILPSKLVNLRIQFFFGGLFLGNRRASTFLKKELTPYVSGLWLTLNIDELVRGFQRGIEEFRRLATTDPELRSRFMEYIVATN